MTFIGYFLPPNIQLLTSHNLLNSSFGFLDILHKLQNVGLQFSNHFVVHRYLLRLPTSVTGSYAPDKFLCIGARHLSSTYFICWSNICKKSSTVLYVIGLYWRQKARRCAAI